MATNDDDGGDGESEVIAGDEETPGRALNPFGSAPIVAAPTGAAVAALVQREVAEVQAMAAMAKMYPRDPRVAIDRILTACARESLAEVAMYQYKRGGQEITGPSIRLAEELARCWGNIDMGVKELVRGEGRSEALAYAIDLETTVRDARYFPVRHWRDTKGGGYALKDERDIYELVANMGARRKRACILSVIPRDVQDAAIRQCEMTLHTKGTVTPERVKKMADSFGEFGVTVEQLEKRIGRRLDTIGAAQMVQMGKVLNSLKDGMSKPADWFEMPEQPDPAAGATSATDAVKRKLVAKQQKSQPPRASEEPPPRERQPGEDDE
jgi:hypothetical protein